MHWSIPPGRSPRGVITGVRSRGHLGTPETCPLCATIRLREEVLGIVSGPTYTLTDPAVAVVAPVVAEAPPAAPVATRRTQGDDVLLVLAAVARSLGGTRSTVRLDELVVAVWCAHPLAFALGSHPHPDSHRVHGVVAKLFAAGLIERPRDGHVVISHAGVQRVATLRRST